MSPEKPEAGSTADWLRRAKDVLAPSEAVEAVSLTSYAVIARYPGDYEDITEETYQEAVRLAQAVLR
jgi:hypothetical protein